MSDAKALRRQLQIKTGVVNRLAKERKLYVKELDEQKQSLDDLVAQGTPEDEWAYKNTKAMLTESDKMIVDSDTRLGKAIADLRELVTSTQEEDGVGDSQEHAQAVAALEALSS